MNQKYATDNFESSLADAFGTISRHSNNEKRFMSTDLRHNDFKECKRRVQSYIGNQNSDISNSSHSDTKQGINDDYPLFHQALKCKTNIIHLKIIGESYLIRRDKFGWNALHYCCRFHAGDLDVMEYVLEKFESKKQELNAPDDFNRYPLHIACDSGASKEVIQLLLTLPVDMERCILTQRTKHLEVGIGISWSEKSLIHEEVLTLYASP